MACCGVCKASTVHGTMRALWATDDGDSSSPTAALLADAWRFELHRRLSVLQALVHEYGHTTLNTYCIWKACKVLLLLWLKRRSPLNP